MRVSIRLLGTEVLAIDTGCDCPDERPRLEAGSGGSFDFGFGTTDTDTLRIGRGIPREEPPDD